MQLTKHMSQSLCPNPQLAPTIKDRAAKNSLKASHCKPGKLMVHLFTRIISPSRPRCWSINDTETRERMMQQTNKIPFNQSCYTFIRRPYQNVTRIISCGKRAFYFVAKGSPHNTGHTTVASSPPPAPKDRVVHLPHPPHSHHRRHRGASLSP